MDSTNLPIINGPFDTLRHGFRSFEYEKSSIHPVQKLENEFPSIEWNAKLEFVNKTYGIACTLKMVSNKHLYNFPRRMHGLKSSTITRDTILGFDEKVDFHDYLNISDNKPSATKLTLHEVMELQFELS